MSRRLSVLAVDDEWPALKRITRLLHELPDVGICGETTSPDEALELCRQKKPDVVLLDIEMPGTDGVSLAKAMRNLPELPHIIFVTAFEEYAIDAFNLAATDYLVKPVRPERLRQALDRAARQRPRARETVQARLGNRLLAIPVDLIRALIAEDKYTLVYHTGGEALIEDSLVTLEQRFGERFVRIHRMALVSREHLRGMFRDEAGQERAQIDDLALTPPISRRNLAMVRELLQSGSQA